MRSNRPEAPQLAGLRGEIRAASPRDLPNLAYQALTVPDASERREALLEAIRATSDPATCVKVIAQFDRITRETGRSHAPLLSAALFEAGKLYGPAMLDAWTGTDSPTPPNYLWETLYGVSFAGPDSAKDWLDHSDPENRKPLISAVVGGAALHDPDQASLMMAALPKEDRMKCISNFTYNIVQKQGLERAVDWMLEVRRSSPEDEADYAAEVENDLFGRLVAAARSNGGEHELAQHLQRINQDEPISAARWIQTVSGLSGTESLNLLDQLVRSPEFAKTTEVKAALLQAVPYGVFRSLESAEVWLSQHPDSPLAPTVRSNLGGQGKH